MKKVKVTREQAKRANVQQKRGKKNERKLYKRII